MRLSSPVYASIAQSAQIKRNEIKYLLAEVWLTIISMMVGATCYALFLAHASAMIQSFDTSSRFYHEKVRLISFSVCPVFTSYHFFRRLLPRF